MAFNFLGSEHEASMLSSGTRENPVQQALGSCKQRGLWWVSSTGPLDVLRWVWILGQRQSRFSGWDPQKLTPKTDQHTYKYWHLASFPLLGGRGSEARTKELCLCSWTPVWLPPPLLWTQRLRGAHLWGQHRPQRKTGYLLPPSWECNGLLYYSPPMLSSDKFLGK